MHIGPIPGSLIETSQAVAVLPASVPRKTPRLPPKRMMPASTDATGSCNFPLPFRHRTSVTGFAPIPSIYCGAALRIAAFLSLLKYFAVMMRSRRCTEVK